MTTLSIVTRTIILALLLFGNGLGAAVAQESTPAPDQEYVTIARAGVAGFPGPRRVTRP